MSQLPEGTTHIGKSPGEFYKITPLDSRTWWNGEWVLTGVSSLSQLTEIVYATSPTPRIAAHEFLERGVKHMRDRAVQRDSDAGERSMARAVVAFNAQEGTNLTEAQGWRFMIQLKYARAVNGVFVADDYEDLCAYGGLAGEAAAAEAK